MLGFPPLGRIQIGIAVYIGPWSLGPQYPWSLLRTQTNLVFKIECLGFLSSSPQRVRLCLQKHPHPLLEISITVH